MSDRDGRDPDPGRGTPSVPAVGTDAPAPPPAGARPARRLDLVTCAGVATRPDRSTLTVAGLVITRQRPGTASGVIFLTLEDETGTANIVVWPKTYERFRRAVIAGRLLRIRGRLQREGAVSHLVAWRIEDMSHLLDRLGLEGPLSAERGDEARRPVPPGSRKPPKARPRARHPREESRTLFPSRDFH